MAAAAAPASPYTTVAGIRKYRPEIDGLRAFAVVAVIINHFNKDLLPSGYLGVDIFFVISGYVITSSLADRKSKNFLDFLTGFYERRLKRLVPALVVFVLITSVVISLFNPDPRIALGLGWRSLFGISNISLYEGSIDYFAESTELNPFTHTWSLGVEEQFYFLFPFLIWFSGFGQHMVNGARNLFFWVGALTVVSLISFIYLYQTNQPAAYFLMPPRFWEMALGCLIYIGFQKRVKIEQALEQVPPLLVVVGMVSVMFLPTAAAVPATLSIGVLTAILIACLKKGTAAYDFFTLQKVVYVGLISYSLYLWHWGVLSISRWTIGIHWWSVPIQVGLIVLAAIASYQWVETPFRKSVLSLERWMIICLSSSASIVASGILFGLSREPIRTSLYLGDPVDTSSEWNRILKYDINGCFSDVEKCLQNNQLFGQVFFWIGDSHASHLLPKANKFSKLHNITIISLNSTGNTFQPFPTINISREGVPAREYGEMGNRLDSLYSKVLPKLNRGDGIIVSLNLPAYFQTAVDDTSYKFLFYSDDGKRIDANTAWKLWREKLIDFARSKRDKGINVIVMIPTPQFDDYPGISVCARQPFRPFQVQGCRIDKSEEDIYGKWAFIINDLKALPSYSENLFVFDTRKAFCTDGKCKNFVGNEMLFMDGNHLTAEGSLLIYPHLLAFLKSANLIP